MYYIKWVRKSDGHSEYLASQEKNGARKEFSSPIEALDDLKKNILNESCWSLDRFDYILELQVMVTIGKLESKTVIDWV